MNLESLIKLDLNLLLCLKVLLEELNVTRAANRLCLSQSAVSKSLAKLRVQFDDPLFVRTSHGLKATPRANNLKPKLDVLIHHIEQINQPDSFNPSSTDTRVNIALVESAYPLILPYFLPSLFEQAPGIRINSHNWSERTFQQLRNGECDFAIKGRDLDNFNSDINQGTPDYISEKDIYRDYQMCVVRRDNPALKHEWSLDNYLSLRHIQVRCNGSDRWLLDYKLGEVGLERDIAITVPDFNNAASLCTYTDFVFTAPHSFTELIAKNPEITLLPLPFELPPMAYTLFWCKDREDDPMLSWLRKMIIAKTADLN